ncbi:hypothetical protein DAI22_04g064832 [Oryza sativa Japonica Group]|nr:hypothetical protein DAI22_04g064832 [Oryza sativa Japonica Group]
MEAAIAALPAKKEALQENGWPQGILQFTHGAASASAVAVSASSCPVKKTQCPCSFAIATSISFSTSTHFTPQLSSSPVISAQLSSERERESCRCELITRKQRLFSDYSYISETTRFRINQQRQAPRKPPRPERTTMMAMAMAEDGSASWFQYSEEMLLPMPPTPFCTTPAVAAVCALWPRVPRT